MDAPPTIKGKSGSSSPTSRKFRLSRKAWFFVALGIFIISTIFAFMQPPRRNPFDAKSFHGLRWFYHPIERNAFKRLPTITSSINDIFVVPETKRLWISGNGGLLAYSDDGGASWPQKDLKESVSSPQEKRAKGAWRLTPGFISTAYAAVPPEQKSLDNEYYKKETAQTNANLDVQQKGLPPQQPPETYQAQQRILEESKDIRQEIQPQRDLNMSDFQGIYFVDSKFGWVVGESGIILHTVDGGVNWNSQISRTTERLNAVQFLDVNQGWAVGGGGTILHTVDGGETWNSQASGTRRVLNDVQFLDVNQGWAAGEGGAILHTVDGGKTWNSQASGTTEGLDDVQFVDANQGWAVGSGSTILHTVDGGKAWNPQTSGITEGLAAVQISNENEPIPLRKANRLAPGLTAVHFLDENQGWIADDGGTILHTVDGGKNWNPQASGIKAALLDMLFLNVNQGWAAGEGGTILHTVDRGKTWNPQTTGAEISPPSTQFLDQSVLAYKKYPAPWYYLVLIVVAALLSLSVRRPIPIAERSTIANMLISDKPLDASAPDAMDFHKIALGLSRFLRNENTQPPLTIAITGAWGTGKSSLMNLLKADLSRFGFRPVWFNVWHHQNEEHLLASLLENIRMQAIPPWWYLTGFIFRMKLLAIRGWRKWVRVLAIMLIFSGSLGYFIKEPSRFSNIGESIKELKVITIDRWFEKNGDFSSREKEGGKPEEGSPITIFLTSVLSGMSLLYAGWRGFKAFGVNPASLMTTMVGSTRMKDLEAQAGFRHTFAMEFQDVTRALNPRTMLILIDDLDRCKPENVLVILEAINFLVSSGDCFVVMGMDRDRVERCVGLGFKDVAEELIEDIEEKDKSREEDISNIQNTEKGTNKDDGRRRRADFAVHYLEKLINIEVPIPKPTPDQSKKLLLSKNTDEQERYQRYERVRNSYALAGKYVVGMAMIGILVFTFWCGYHIERTDTTGDQTKVTAETNAVVVPQSGEQAEQKAVSSPEAEKPEIKERGRVINPDMEKLSSLRYVWVALIFLPVGYWVFSRRSGVVIKDSDDFTKALDIWSKVIFMKNLTPRSVKRFINRVRYFAMCLRREEEGLTLWERFLYWRAGSGVEQKGRSDTEIKRADEAAIKNQQGIPEPVLVAMSAIHHVYPVLIEKDGLFLTGASKSHEISKEVNDALQAHTKTFCSLNNVGETYSLLENDWETYRQQFLTISKGIRIH
ncbi:MAG: hypothetical protein AYP45_10410 [Candidatus Brocadia carolinensis]|uniref:Photosynthesis system II assembly factor Ycf48/Hcf136-like domain-containing protein n=1 Tax=Candidatus Brocadia carolinensis TaxID=1004156 RepID=A0A1V4ASW4_9BACT|nr:MAG: hypothetical protein AYP45_10410 [Candidatus Brocadia caroliniensis]